MREQNQGVQEGRARYIYTWVTNRTKQTQIDIKEESGTIYKSTNQGNNKESNHFWKDKRSLWSSWSLHHYPSCPSKTTSTLLMMPSSIASLLVSPWPPMTKPGILLASIPTPVCHQLPLLFTWRVVRIGTPMCHEIRFHGLIFLAVTILFSFWTYHLTLP